MNKKEEIINTARKLFLQYGYTKVSMEEIAKCANVTKKTIYSHFKDKSSLFQYFIDEELNKIKTDIDKKEKKDLPFIEKVGNVLFYVLNYKKESQLLKAISNDKDIRYCTNLLEKYDQEIMDYIKRKLDKEMASGNIKKCNTKLMAFIIYKMYLSLLFDYEDELNEKEITKEMNNILKEGLFN